MLLNDLIDQPTSSDDDSLIMKLQSDLQMMISITFISIALTLSFSLY
jgi:hypothetical protein